MKKVLLTLLSVATLLVLVSCGEDKKKPAEQTSTPAPAPKQEEKLIEKESLFILQSASLYDFNEDGKMVWVAEANDGDAVKVMYKANGEPYKKTVIRLIAKSKQEDEMEFIKVIYDEKEYWSRAIFVSIPDAIPAIITDEKAYILSEPDIISITEKSLPFGTLVALDNFVNEDYVKAIIYNANQDFGKVVYLKKSAVSSNKKDIATYLTVKNLAEKKELDEVVFNEINDILSGFDLTTLSPSISDYYDEQIEAISAKFETEE